MSEELVNSVKEMLKEETWTRTGINNFTKKNLDDLKVTLDKVYQEGVASEVKEICSHTKDSLVALYLSGMIALKDRELNNNSLELLTDIFERNHKESLTEDLCKSILEDESNKDNKFALRKLADYYKSNNDERKWEYYERIVRIDLSEAELAKELAAHYEEQQNPEAAIKFYKRALQRFISQKNESSTTEIWNKLVLYFMGKNDKDLDFLLTTQRSIAKEISEKKASECLKTLCKHYREVENWDVAISILKKVLEYDNGDESARKELVACYRQRYADQAHLESCIQSSNIERNTRNVFAAISDFEKHIAFNEGNYVFHRSWGVGRISKVEDKTKMITINFGKKNGKHDMSLEMAVNALLPLPKDHIWVYKATKRKEELVKFVKGDAGEDKTQAVHRTLTTIIKSFDNRCDEKRIKAELVPSILTAGEWTSWHQKAQTILRTDSRFDVCPDDRNSYMVREHEMTMTERLINEFKAEKQFFPRVDILYQYLEIADDEASTEQFSDMCHYFESYLKSINNVDKEVVGAYLVVQEKLSNYVAPLKFNFEQLYSEIENPRELYSELKDSKRVSLKKLFIKYVRTLSDWDNQFITLFPTVLDKKMLDDLIAAGKTDKVVRLVQDSFNDYRNYRDASVYFFKECRNEEWFKQAGIDEERQLVTLVNIISVCYREIENHANTVDNKKTIKAATTQLFGTNSSDGSKSVMLNYMLNNGIDVITRMYTMVNDVRDLEPEYKQQLRNGIIGKYPDFKFQEKEVKTEAPKGLWVTAKMLAVKKDLAEDIEKRQLVEIGEEVKEAKEKGDLKENAEYIAAKEKQHRLNDQFNRLKEELARAIPVDINTANTSMVSFGTTVTLHNNLENRDDVYTILGPWESNVDAGIISYLSPLGNNLLDARVGDHLTFVINEHPYDLEVKSIERWVEA